MQTILTSTQCQRKNQDQLKYYRASMRQNSLIRDQSGPTRISVGRASSKVSRFGSRKKVRQNTLDNSERAAPGGGYYYKKRQTLPAYNQHQ